MDSQAIPAMTLGADVYENCFSIPRKLVTLLYIYRSI